MSKKKMIILRSSDEEDFEIDDEIAGQSETLQHMIDDECTGDFIPLPNVNSKILTLVIKFCKNRLEKDMEEDERKKFDAEFVKVDDGTLFELILAANYLTIKTLMDLTCQTVADNIKDKSVEEVRALFGIENDYTPEEEAQLRSENAWAFEGFD